MKQMETVMVMIVFFILLAIALIFYGFYSKVTITKSQAARFESESVKIMQEIIFLPELSCTDKNTVADVCIDKYKAEAFAQLAIGNTDSALFYRRHFGDIKILYWEVYPSNPSYADPSDILAVPINVILLYENNAITPNDEKIVKQEVAEIPVSLKDPSKLFNEYAVGVLRVEVTQYEGKKVTAP